MPRQAKAAAAVARTEKGHFPKGVSGNPTGLPTDGLRGKQKIVALKESLELAVLHGPLTATRLCNIVNKMIELGEKGDVKAAKLVWLMATHTAGSDDVKTPASIKIVVENATFKSAAVVEMPTVKVTEAIDVEFEDKKDGSRTPSKDGAGLRDRPQGSVGA